MQTRSFPIHVHIRISWWGKHELYFNGIITLLYKVNNFVRNNIQFTVHLYHDSSVSRKCLKILETFEIIKFHDMSMFKLDDGFGLLWRFMEIGNEEENVNMILDLDEDTFSIIMQLENFIFSKIRNHVFEHKCTLLTHKPYWKIGNLDCLVPANFCIFINGHKDTFIRNIHKNILNFVFSTKYVSANKNMKKLETGITYGNSYQSDEYFLTYVMLCHKHCNVSLYRTQLTHRIHFKSTDMHWDDETKCIEKIQVKS